MRYIYNTGCGQCLVLVEKGKVAIEWANRVQEKPKTEGR